MNGTLIRHDPTETPRTVELRVWYDNEGKSMDLPDLSKGGDMTNRQSLLSINVNLFFYANILCCFFFKR